MLTGWLREQATQYEKRDLARTYVAVREGQHHVLGYYAISGHRVSFEALPDEQARGLPKIHVPVILLGRLAVDRSVQGQGLGKHLVIDALRRAQQIADQVGIRAVEVDAIDEDARGFYLRLGFNSLRDHPRHLVMPMQTIRGLRLPPLA